MKALTALTVGVALLLWAGAAAADSAWMLWKQTTSPVDSWELIGAHSTMEECSRHLVDFALFLSEKEGYVLSGLSAGATTVNLHNEKERGAFLCVPDTADPRGPKVK